MLVVLLWLGLAAFASAADIRHEELTGPESDALNSAVAQAVDLRGPSVMESARSSTIFIDATGRNARFVASGSSGLNLDEALNTKFPVRAAGLTVPGNFAVAIHLAKPYYETQTGFARQLWTAFSVAVSYEHPGGDQSQDLVTLNFFSPTYPWRSDRNADVCESGFEVTLSSQKIRQTTSPCFPRL